MMEPWRLGFQPYSTGCAICESQDKGNLVSSGLSPFSSMQCIPCMYVGGRLDLDYKEIEPYRELGHLQHSTKAFKAKKLQIERFAY